MIGCSVVLGHFAKLGASLDSAVGTYNMTLASVETRMLVSARKMAELGARSDRELPELSVIDTRPREVTASSPSSL